MHRQQALLNRVLLAGLEGSITLPGNFDTLPLDERAAVAEELEAQEIASRRYDPGSRPSREITPLAPSLPGNPLILVVGIHRTLSSCFGVMLEKLGVWMGNTPPGSGEDQALARICERLMLFPSARKAPSRGLFAELIRELMEREGPCGLKYPTMCAYLDEISEAWPNLKIIHCSRPLDESVQSLVTRSATRGLPATAPECEMIQRYLQDRLQAFLANREHLTIEAGDVLENPGREIRRVIDYLGLTPSAAQIAQAASVPAPEKSPHSKAGRAETAHWEDVTTICIKTFERPDCLDRCIASIRARHPSVKIFVADDSRQPRPEMSGVDHVFVMPYDSGLSAGRNLMVKHVETPYVMILDDDMEFTDETNIDRLYQDIRLHGFDLAAMIPRRPDNPETFLASFSIDGDALTMWSSPAGFHCHVPKYDLAHNCFLARTDRIHPWNERLKVGEHLEWFIRGWHEGPLLCSVRPESTLLDSQTRTTPGYQKMRARQPRLSVVALREWCERLGVRKIVRQPQGTTRIELCATSATRQ